MTAIGEGKVSKTLKKFLTEQVSENKKLKSEVIAVSDPKLGKISIYSYFQIRLVTDDRTNLNSWSNFKEIKFISFI